VPHQHWIGRQNLISILGMASHGAICHVVSYTAGMQPSHTQPQVQTVLSKKPEVADFSKGADVLGTSREELESASERFSGVSTPSLRWPHLRKSAPSFQSFQQPSYRLLLLPVGTANVERSFSTLNRILSSERCRLVPGHTCQLMQLAVEGLVCQMSVTLRWKSWRIY